MTESLNRWPAGVPRARWLMTLAMLLLTLVAALAHGPAWADPPSRAGRLAEMTGTVWLYDAEEREWVQMHRNQTVGEGDRLRADDGSGATVTIGTATLWMDQRSEIEFNALADSRIAVQIVKGGVGLRVRGQESADEWTLRTLEGRFGFEREGLYRVSQLDRGSEAQAWQGKLRFDSRATDAQPVWLGTNEQAEFWWDNGPRTERQPLQQDGFARLILEDNRDLGAQPLVGSGTPVPYVSPEMTGAEDLARYGAWEQSPDYGAVWVPTVVVADWAPYRYGRWVWSARWGYTWVDDMPWGFAPFHYGRWAYWRDRWCWVPGPYVRRPAYAPALVGWVGPGISVGVVVGGGRGRRPTATARPTGAGSIRGRIRRPSSGRASARRTTAMNASMAPCSRNGRWPRRCPPRRCSRSAPGRRGRAGRPTAAPTADRSSTATVMVARMVAPMAAKVGPTSTAMAMAVRTTSAMHAPATAGQCVA